MTTDLAPPWSPLRRVAFRFAALYLVLYAAPSPLPAVVSFPSEAPEWYRGLTRRLAELTGRLIGVVPPPAPLQNGSSDTTRDYLLVLATLVIAALGTAVWSVVDARRPDYRRGWAVLRVWLRYVVGCTMLAYGFAKVVPVQFLPPDPGRLFLTFGASSPMGLLWTFMGASPAYTIFGGAAEVLGAALLFSRKTATAGALVLAAVLTNVVMLNLCYDVCVKQYSMHLLLMSLVLLAPSATRLFDAVVLGKAVAAETPGPALDVPRIPPRLLLGVKVAFLVAVVRAQITPAIEHYLSWKNAGRPAVDGAWDVDEVRVDGVVETPTPTSWRRVLVSRGFASTRQVDGAARFFKVDYGDTGAAKLVDSNGAASSFERDGDGAFVTSSTPDGHVLRVRLRPTDPSNELLVRRGFHWVNERPFNR
jgi:hypothetical protein